MKKTLLYLVFIFIWLSAIAQETVPQKAKKLQQLYFSYSPGLAYSNFDHTIPKSWHRKLHITATTREHYIFRFGSSYTSLLDNQPVIKKWNEDYPDRPFLLGHYIFSPHLLIGKRKVLSDWMQVQMLAGPSFNNQNSSVNIHRITEDFGPYSHQERLVYDRKTRFSPGFLVQAEVMAVPLRFASLTFGGYFQYIPKFSYGGFNMSLNVGRIRTKEI